jgi:hypothetical protein
MKTETRIYIVAGKDAGIALRLIRTTHPARAMAHVADSMLEARVATQEDLERLLPLGVKVERIHEAPAA